LEPAPGAVASTFGTLAREVGEDFLRLPKLRKGWSSASNRYEAQGQRPLATRQSDARKPPTSCSRRGIGSRARAKAAHRLLVFIHPGLELFVRKKTRRGERRLFATQAFGNE